MISEKNISEILNLIGYGLAKYNLDFVKEFGFITKSSFHQYIVDLGFAKTTKVVSNRQDSFDPYFDNGRKGWWQRKQREYIKLFIDSLFGAEDVKSFANIVKLYILEFDSEVKLSVEKIKPTIKSKFKQLQETGNEAEFFFMKNYKTIPIFKDGILEDARLWGDGYDFQIQLNNDFLLAEIKGLSKDNGSIRITNNEYNKALEFSKDYYIIVVSNLINTPKMTIINDPINNLLFTPKEIPTIQKFFHTKNLKW